MYAIPDSIRITKTNDGALVLAIATGKVLRLNPAGLLILEQLQAGTSESGIVDALAAGFAISRELAGQDVGGFLKELEQLGVIERSGAGQQKAWRLPRSGQLP